MKHPKITARLAVDARAAIACWVLALLLSGMGASEAQARDARHAEVSRAACLLVDTDAGLDDFRAFGVLAPARSIDAVVVTEGISSVERGHTAVELLLSTGPSSARVISGESALHPPDYDWLPEARAGAERLNGFIAEAISAGGSEASLRAAVAKSLRGCRRVDVLVLGPWSSFVRYAPVLRRSIGRVVVSGRPLPEVTPDDFNCVYDLPACTRAYAMRGLLRDAVWVDLPTDSGDSLTYTPTEEMIARLEETRLPGLLRAALRLDPSQWLETRLWDDSVASYLIDAEGFAPEGLHLEPVIGQDELRTRLVGDINAAPGPRFRRKTPHWER